LDFIYYVFNFKKDNKDFFTFGQATHLHI
jgi:hypothetical protein